MKQTFKPIKGYEGFYQINTDGIVVSLARTMTRRDGFQRRVSEKIIYPTSNQYGAKMIVLSKEGKYELRNLDHLMMETFNDDYNIRTDRILHKDGDKSNKKLSNLKNEMILSRSGGRVTVTKKNRVKSKQFLTLKIAGEALGFNHKTLLNNVVDGVHESTGNTKLEFEIPFVYGNKTIRKIEL